MPQATQAAFDARVGVEDGSLAGARPAVDGVRLAVHDDLAAVERDWRAFEKIADGTVFQSYDWVSLWQHHIGRRNGVQPIVVTGHDRQGQLLFLLPLGIEHGGLVRRLTWLGTMLCDYNGPLLAPDFGARVDAARFRELWSAICGRLQGHPQYRFDVVHFDKMQRVVGSQPNPFVGLGVIPHANGAYVTRLGADWESFYTEKRSSATRRRDRTKRKKLGEFGEVKFVTAQGAPELSTHARNADGSEVQVVRGDGRDQHLCAAGLQRFLSRAVAHAGLRARQPARRRHAGGRRQSRPDLPRLATITCWRATTAAICRNTDPAPRTCTICCATRWSDPARRSTSPSATSATSRNGATATSCCSTTFRRRPRAAASRRRSSCRRARQALHQAEPGAVGQGLQGPRLDRVG